MDNATLEQAIWLASMKVLLLKFSESTQKQNISIALNLCFVSASNVQATRNMYGTMQEICHFLTFHLSDKLSLKRTSQKKERVEGKSLLISAKPAG